MRHPLRQLFRRYAVQHQWIRLPGFELRDGAGRIAGRLETLEIRHNRLRAAGWARAGQVALIAPNGRAECRPDRNRPEAAGAAQTGTGGDAPGFHLEWPFEAGSPVTLWMATAGEQRQYPLTLPGRAALGWRRLMLVPPFLLALLRALPAGLRWRRTRDPAARARIKELLGLSEVRAGVPLLPDPMFRDAPTGPPADPPAVTLIVPVHNAFDVLPEMLDRVVRHTDLPWHLVLVEDGSTDPRVRPWLRDWVTAREAEAPGRVTLIENPRNLGFVGSANAGLEIARARGAHLVLLNSDALVPAGWASRLLAPMLAAEEEVASVTPMSNDAEILSVPAIGRATALPPEAVDRIDAVARTLAPAAATAELPTGIGFCMAINRRFLAQAPRLDAAFGRGYGEEVDWCQKVRSAGGRHLGVATLFVEHRGGASFGTAKQGLVARSQSLISSRYPGYDAEVQDFVRSDPLLPPRLALALALVAAAAKEPVPVYLAHTLGGGAEMDLTRLIGAAAARGTASVVLRVGGAHRWQIELHRAGAPPLVAGAGAFGQVEALLLRCLPERRVIYSCGVGDPDPLRLPGRLLRLKGASGGLEVRLHDFFALSPSYCLLDSDGWFRGVPAPDDPDPAHAWPLAGGGRAPLAEWRAAWGRLIAAADRVVAFSGDSAAHVRAAYPAAPIEVRPHPMLTEVPPARPRASRRPVIGVLGNINRQKGAEVVVGLAQRLKAGDRGKLVLIGDLDPDYVLPAPAVLHGRYRIGDIPALVARYGITHWVIPSIWPETFSFTTREALATGLPVLCFDIGAQGEAARAAPNGHPVPYRPGADLVAALLGALGQEPDATAGGARSRVAPGRP